MRLRCVKWMILAYSVASGYSVYAHESVSSGKAVFDTHCAACHEGDSGRLGPSLVGIVGRKVGTTAADVHPRGVFNSEFVWDRMLLRRFLSNPGRENPGTVMPVVDISDPRQLEDLLNYLELLR